MMVLDSRRLPAQNSNLHLRCKRCTEAGTKVMPRPAATSPRAVCSSFASWTTRNCSPRARKKRQGKWQQLYRVVGEYANYSIFDVESNDELHTLLAGLPLFPYMKLARPARGTGCFTVTWSST
jgi:muconolactone delta-isomerase